MLYFTLTFTGVCQCTEGYGMADCSVDVTQPPQIYQLTSAVCDTAVDSCDLVTVIGDRFVDSGSDQGRKKRATGGTELTCHLESVQVRNDTLSLH